MSRGRWTFDTFYEGSGQPIKIAFEGDVIDTSSFDGPSSAFGLGRWSISDGTPLSVFKGRLLAPDGHAIRMPTPPLVR